MLTASSPRPPVGVGGLPPAPRGTPAQISALRVLTLAGFVVPNAMLAIHVGQAGADPADYFGAWLQTLPAAQLLADLAITSLAFIAWAAFDGRRLQLRWWITVPATLLVGICFAVPLYLLLRERALLEGSSVQRSAHA